MPFCSSQQHSRACSDCLNAPIGPADKAKVFIWRKVGPAGRATLPSQKGDTACRVTVLAEPTFCFSCKPFAKFVSNCMKSWLAYNSSDWSVNFLYGLSFGSLHVSGKLSTYPFPKPTLTLTSHLGQNVGLGEG